MPEHPILTLRFFLIAFSALYLTSARPAAAASLHDHHDRNSAIDRIAQNKSLSSEQKLIYQVYSIFGDDEKLPTAYRSAGAQTPYPCATPIILEIGKNWNSYSEDARNIFQSYGLGPYQKPFGNIYDYYDEHLYEKGLFTIHYFTESGYAVDLTDVAPSNGVPDYVELMAAVFNEVWQKEIDEMGYTRPPEDYEGGNDYYHVYIGYIGSYGYTHPYFEYEDATGDNIYSPEIETLAMSSYIVMRNEYDSFVEASPDNGNTAESYLKVTAAHEFFHAIQLGYNSNENPWLLEASATWMEDETYDDVNDSLQYLENIFYDPDVSFNYWGYRWYGMWIYFRYASERLGSGFVKDVWEESKSVSDPGYDDHSFEVLDAAFNAHGTAMADITANYHTANLVLATPPDHEPYNYEEAELYPSAYIEGHLTPTVGGSIFDSYFDGNNRLGFYGVDYIQLASTENVLVEFETDDPETDFGIYVLTLAGGSYSRVGMDLDAQKSGSLLLEAPAEEAYVLVMNLGDTREDPDYKVTATKQTQAPTIISTPCLLGDVGSPYRYDCTPYSSSSSAGGPKTDFDGSGQNVTWQAANAPSGFSINSSTGAISWTPSSAGEYQISITATAEIASDPQTFTVTVEAASAAPSPLDDFTATPNDGSAVLSWEPPADPDMKGIVIVRNQDHAPASRSDGDIVYNGEGAETQHTDQGLTNGQAYHYAAFVFDAQANDSPPAADCVAPEAIALSLKADWNLIALPIEPSDGDWNALFGDTCGTGISAATYSEDGYMLPGAIYDHNRETAAAVWVCSTADVSSFAFSGKVSQDEVISKYLDPRWNAIGNPFFSDIGWDDASIRIGPIGQENELSQAISSGWTNGKLYGYDRENKAFAEILPNNGESLSAWSGYFLKIDPSCNNCSISFSHTNLCSQ